MATARRSSGVVSAFDDEVGLGTITARDGTVVAFHCTRLADLSRHIDPGTAVTYALVAGHLGRWEADDVRPTPT